MFLRHMHFYTLLAPKIPLLKYIELSLISAPINKLEEMDRYIIRKSCQFDLKLYYWWDARIYSEQKNG